MTTQAKYAAMLIQAELIDAAFDNLNDMVGEAHPELSKELRAISSTWAGVIVVLGQLMEMAKKEEGYVGLHGDRRN